MKRVAILVIGLGFVLRLFAFQYTYVINPDGVVYIHQARALYYGLTDALTSCKLNYLSNYPLFIAGAYPIFGDWVVAAKSVSLFFGTMTLVPLYFLSKRIFDEDISILVILIFALIPTFVDRSVDVIKGSVFWFFLVLGLYLFVRQLDRRSRLFLLLSSLSFLLATWARAEFIVLIIVSFFYLLLTRQERKFETVSIFILPIVILMLIAISGVLFDVADFNLFRLKAILSKATSVMDRYEFLRNSISDLARPLEHRILKRFLFAVRDVVWWLALGFLLTKLLNTLFYPFFLVFLVGFKGIVKKIKEDRRVCYLCVLSLFALLFLYVFVILKWVVGGRFMAIFIFPSFIFIGFGLEKIISFFQSRFSLKKSTALALVCFLILAVSLPKNLTPNRKGKHVFVKIAELIKEREANNEEILVLGFDKSSAWVSFYTNVNFKGAPCPLKNYDLESIIGNNYKEFIQNLSTRGINYLLWEEKHWPPQSADYLRIGQPTDFVKIGTWSHPDTGKLMLFEVKHQESST